MLVLYCYPCYGLAWQDLGAVSCNIGQIVKPLMYPHVFLVPLVRSVDVWKTSLPLFMSRNLMLSNWLSESQKVLARAVFFCYFLIIASWTTKASETWRSWNSLSLHQYFCSGFLSIKISTPSDMCQKDFFKINSTFLKKFYFTTLAKWLFDIRIWSSWSSYYSNTQKQLHD